jgi:hypothetical protein
VYVVLSALLAGAVVLIVWTLSRRNTVFVLEVRDQSLRLEGDAPPRFVADCKELLDEAGVANGSVRGQRRGSQVALVFSHTIPRALRQRIRNVWTVNAR